MNIEALIKIKRGFSITPEHCYYYCVLTRAEDGELIWVPYSYFNVSQSDAFSSEESAQLVLQKKLKVIQSIYGTLFKKVGRSKVVTWFPFNQEEWEKSLEDSDVSQNG